VLLVVVDELLDEHGHGCEHDAERVAALVALADRLLAVAGRTQRAAVAGWIATVAAERDGRVLDAESHLRAAAVAGRGWELVEDRLAAYESDRGDAAAALGRWLAIDAGVDEPDVVAVRPFATAVGPEPGRNDPCWCGSGRKYKQCHLGTVAVAPLAERAAWLYRKAVGYLERRGGATTELLDLHAATLAGDDGGDPGEEDDPLVADTALDEGGWFAAFLADRGPLLPADERELAASWLPVRRSVFEVVDARHVRDVRTGSRLAISGPAPRSGEWICARALPDGAGSHLLVAAVVIDRDTDGMTLAVLGQRDAIQTLDLLAVDMLEPRSVLHPPAPPRPATVAPVVLQLQERREQRWCDEPAPALDGLTPRAAATDPARRDAVLALIASAPPDDPATGKLGLRPARLRELLGLG
jgi:SEC-C motif